MDRKRDMSKEKETKKKEDYQICFVIMPFGGWFDTYYEDVYCPAIKEAGLMPHRADDLNRPGVIVKDIWNYTKQARIVVADLSGRNPNVLYELGLAHAIAKPAILLTQTLDDVPFDLQTLRVIIYDRNAPNWGDTLKIKISQSIKEVLKSPLKAVLPVFLEVTEVVRKKVTPHDKEMLEIKQEIELLKHRMSSPGPYSLPSSQSRWSLPAISIDPDEGLLGTNVRIVGTGWRSLVGVDIVIGGVMLCTFLADPTGAFVGQLQIPDFLKRDQYIPVVARDSRGNASKTVFHVTSG